MRTLPFATVTLAAVILASPAWSQPVWKNQGQGSGQDHGNHGGNRGGPGPQDSRGGQYVVADHDRSAVSSYYRDEFARGNCPPGLAKKDNGCLPPGQARKMWAVGEPLSRSVTYYPLPQPLYSRLTPPPRGYDYVRVDDDVLMMRMSDRAVINLVVNLR